MFKSAGGVPALHIIAGSLSDDAIEAATAGCASPREAAAVFASKSADGKVATMAPTSAAETELPEASAAEEKAAARPCEEQEAVAAIATATEAASAQTAEDAERERKVRAKAAARAQGNRPTEQGAAVADARAAEADARAAAAPHTAAAEAPAATPGAAAGQFFSLAELQTQPFPAGVDAARRESYLEDAVFATLFGMDRATFASLPKWKQAAAKKKHQLF